MLTELTMYITKVLAPLNQLRFTGKISRSTESHIITKV